MIFVFLGVLILALSVAVMLRSAMMRLELPVPRWLVILTFFWCVLGGIGFYVFLGAPVIVPLLAS